MGYCLMVHVCANVTDVFEIKSGLCSWNYRSGIANRTLFVWLPKTLYTDSLLLCHLFILNWCSLSALIENKLFSVHGGLSPAINTLDQVSNKVIIHLFFILCINKWIDMIYFSDSNNWSEARSTAWWCNVWPHVVRPRGRCRWLGVESPWCWFPFW